MFIFLKSAARISISGGLLKCIGEYMFDRQKQRFLAVVNIYQGR